jgi:hypothetical protein
MADLPRPKEPLPDVPGLDVGGPVSPNSSPNRMRMSGHIPDNATEEESDSDEESPKISSPQPSSSPRGNSPRSMTLGSSVEHIPRQRGATGVNTFFFFWFLFFSSVVVTSHGSAVGICTK